MSAAVVPVVSAPVAESVPVGSPVAVCVDVVAVVSCAPDVDVTDVVVDVAVDAVEEVELGPELPLSVPFEEVELVGEVVLLPESDDAINPVVIGVLSPVGQPELNKQRNTTKEGGYADQVVMLFLVARGGAWFPGLSRQRVAACERLRGSRQPVVDFDVDGQKAGLQAAQSRK